ncbi:hypothetical protein Clacol_010459 [Clathrus columnatus]|uniref:Peptidase A1 domain-containing protein n=1 Tax=Clathrus columnatus TaxID=1419009 RepID=A0AAV5ATU8_9AGAM|nr:hypothetical protein Clacol_010459 [Clathrus columnatus]
MFCKASLLTLVFYISITAGHVCKEAGRVNINLAHRGSLTKPDGTFDQEESDVDIRMTTAKYRNHASVQRNFEGECPNNVGSAIENQNPLIVQSQRHQQTLARSTTDNIYDLKIGGAAVTVLGQEVVSGFQTVMDSGSLHIFGPPSDVEKFYSKIPGSQLIRPKKGVYAFPCSSVPSVSFSWDGKRTWTMSSDTFNLGPFPEDPSLCVGSIVARDLSGVFGDGVWVLGEMFMRNVYSAFSVDTAAIGFATLKETT